MPSVGAIATATCTLQPIATPQELVRLQVPLTMRGVVEGATVSHNVVKRCMRIDGFQHPFDRQVVPQMTGRRVLQNYVRPARPSHGEEEGCHLTHDVACVHWLIADSTCEVVLGGPHAPRRIQPHKA